MLREKPIKDRMKEVTIPTRNIPFFNAALRYVEFYHLGERRPAMSTWPTDTLFHYWIPNHIPWCYYNSGETLERKEYDRLIGVYTPSFQKHMTFC